MPAPLEILKFLPKTNCGRCGYPTCLAFAFALSSGATQPERCPDLDPKLLPELKPQETLPDEDYAWKVLEEVKKKALQVDWKKVAPNLGLSPLSGGQWRVHYLDLWVRLGREGAKREDGLELDPRDQILLFNYIALAGQTPLSGEFVGLEAFPHSISKVATLRRYAEERLAQAFTGKLELLRKLLQDFEVDFPADTPADLGATVYVLPKIPLRVHFFEGDPEEGLPSEVKILFDREVIHYLDLESLVFCAERLVERLEEKAAL